MTTMPLLYHIPYQNKEILFIHTGIVGGLFLHYYVLEAKPSTKFVELNKMTSEYTFVESVGKDHHSIYVPIVTLVKSTLIFPIDN